MLVDDVNSDLDGLPNTFECFLPRHVSLVRLLVKNGDDGTVLLRSSHVPLYSIVGVLQLFLADAALAPIHLPPAGRRHTV